MHRFPFLARRSRTTGAALLAALTLGTLAGPALESSSAPALAGRTVPYTPPPAPTAPDPMPSSPDRMPATIIRPKPCGTARTV